MAEKPTERQVIELQAEGFLRRNKMNNMRIDSADDYCDTISNDEKLYVVDAMVNFYLTMKK